jgi:hypothetical protein
MDYNTQKKRLVLPEYGRNIQKMVDYAIELEDEVTKKKAVKTIIGVMGNLYPHLRDVPDFRHKLWDHLAILSDFKLCDDSPYPLPDMEEKKKRPIKMPYSNQRIKYKHYGKTIEKFISKIDSIEDETSKKNFINRLANHMKKSFIMWNNNSVEDKQIIHDFKYLSPVDIDDDIDLQEVQTRTFPRKHLNRPERNDKNHRSPKRPTNTRR